MDKVLDLLKQIKGTITDEEWDDIIMAAINVYCKELDDSKSALANLIPRLVGNRPKMLANIACGKLKGAYLIAARIDDIEFVEIIKKEAQKTNQTNMLAICENYLLNKQQPPQ